METSTMGKAARAQQARPLISPGLAFAAILVLWLAFGVSLVADSGGLNELWGRIQGMWLPIRAIVWLFFLPWMLALWAWQADWSLWVRLAIVCGLAVATIAAFYPRGYES
jgi:hypothetical protein